MRLLLDTHALLWFLLADSRLSGKALDHIRDGSSMVHVSPASLWEIAIKISLGKYELPGPFDRFWQEQLRINDILLLQFTIEHAACIAELPFYHRDPFDRCIIAQSLVEGISVIGSDTAFDRYGVTRIW